MEQMLSINNDINNHKSAFDSLNLCDRSPQKDLKMQYIDLGEWFDKTFTPSKTIDEANQWAKERLFIEHVDYSGFNINVANLMNRELYLLKQIFPEIFPAIRNVGRIDKMLLNGQAVSALANDKKESLQIFKNDAKSRVKRKFVKNVKLCKNNDKNVKTANSFQTKFNEFSSRMVPLQDTEKGMKIILKLLSLPVEKVLEGSLKGYVTLTTLVDCFITDAYCIINGNLSGIYMSPFNARGNYKQVINSWDGISRYYSRGKNSAKGAIYHEFTHELFEHFKNRDLVGFVSEKWDQIKKEGRKGKRKVKNELSWNAKRNEEEYYSEAINSYFVDKRPSKLALEMGNKTGEALEMLRKMGTINA